MGVNKGFEERERALENIWARGEDAKRLAELKAQLAASAPGDKLAREVVSDSVQIRQEGLDVGGEGQGAHGAARGFAPKGHTGHAADRYKGPRTNGH